MDIEPFSLLFTALIADTAIIGCNLIVWFFVNSRANYFFIQLVSLPFGISCAVTLMSVSYTYYRRIHPRNVPSMKRVMFARLTGVLLFSINYLFILRYIPSTFKYADLIKDYTFVGLFASILGCLAFLGIVMGDLNTTPPTEPKAPDLMA